MEEANLKKTTWTNRGQALVFGLRFCALTFFDKNRLSGFRRDDAAGGDRGGLPHAATKEFARSYRINLRLLPELAFSSGHDEVDYSTGPVRCIVQIGFAVDRRFRRGGAGASRAQAR